ncbi:hypothetical protein CISG_01681 [Coccidioides immitis RMSCC 3703]|uniref:Protein kinase domain-containing protein n=1 Tax=Coccidioides immitis RMSCC 3703 TaxID=454286 RepID=A0A0J8R1N7_COCIT|nr:hypothetical protein CISG_01681 [Coccidioides immitis RMSCC 3703]
MEEDELTRLRRLYEEEKRLREEEQRRREAAESNALEAQLRREAAEELARGAQPQTVEQYLEACHSLQLSIQIVTNPALTTQGEPTNPSNRLFPRRIIPWGEDFAMQQEAIWNQLKGSSLFSSQPLFPSQHSLQFVKSYLRPLSTKCLAAAIVTQLFSYMIGKGIQYGYVCTGEAFVFLHIPNDDPTIVYFSLCVPSLDVMDDDQTRLHRTAAAQAFAFAIQALSVDPPPASWHDRTTTLDVWPVEYDDVLRDIPETVRKEPRATPYKPQRWKGFKRSPIQTRSRCKPLDSDMVADDDSSSSEEGPPSPSPKHSYRSGRRQALMSPGTRSDKKPNSSRRGQQPVQQRVINNRPFCTQKCLLGLANGGPVDETCPNFEHHGPEHISQQEFQQLIREQLAKDRGPDADCVPLYISGALGSLFKPKAWRALILTDSSMRTRSTIASDLSRATYKEMHKLGVLHCDAAPRNVLHDKHTGTVMIVDFERSELDSREALGPISPNAGNRKRKRVISRQGEDAFARELSSIVTALSRMEK